MSKTEKEMIADMYKVEPNAQAHSEFFGEVTSVNPSGYDSKPKQYRIGIDTFQRAKANMSKKEYIACIKFNIDKYNWREKDQDIEDFKKIIAYANEAISVLEQYERNIHVQ